MIVDLNVAFGKPTIQSGYKHGTQQDTKHHADEYPGTDGQYGLEGAPVGKFAADECIWTEKPLPNTASWWAVDIQESVTVGEVVIVNRNFNS